MQFRPCYWASRRQKDVGLWKILLLSSSLDGCTLGLKRWDLYIIVAFRSRCFGTEILDRSILIAFASHIFFFTFWITLYSSLYLLAIRGRQLHQGHPDRGIHKFRACQKWMIQLNRRQDAINFRRSNYHKHSQNWFFVALVNFVCFPPLLVHPDFSHFCHPEYVAFLGTLYCCAEGMV